MAISICPLHVPPIAPPVCPLLCPPCSLCAWPSIRRRWRCTPAGSWMPTCSPSALTLTWTQSSRWVDGWGGGGGGGAGAGWVAEAVGGQQGGAAGLGLGWDPCAIPSALFVPITTAPACPRPPPALPPPASHTPCRSCGARRGLPPPNLSPSTEPSCRWGVLQAGGTAGGGTAASAAATHCVLRGICRATALSGKTLPWGRLPTCLTAQCCRSHTSCMQPQHPNWAAACPAPPPPALLSPLIEAADAVGKLVQYRHQVPPAHLPACPELVLHPTPMCFVGAALPAQPAPLPLLPLLLPPCCMAGLAAIEFAQALQQLVSGTCNRQLQADVCALPELRMYELLLKPPLPSCLPAFPPLAGRRPPRRQAHTCGRRRRLALRPPRPQQQQQQEQQRGQPRLWVAGCYGHRGALAPAGRAQRPGKAPMLPALLRHASQPLVQELVALHGCCLDYISLVCGCLPSLPAHLPLSFVLSFSPCQQVIWVDLLTEREFSAGFGSHTPMFTGQVGMQGFGQGGWLRGRRSASAHLSPWSFHSWPAPLDPH